MRRKRQGAPGREGERCLPQRRREQNVQLEQRRTVKWSLLELMSPHIKTPANESLFIIGKRKSSHNPISCLLMPAAGSAEAHLDGRWTMGAQRGSLT